MLRRCLLACIIPCLGWQLSAQASPASSPSVIAGPAQTAPSVQDAQQLLDKGKLAESTEELNALSKLIPEPAGVERLLGFVYYQQNRFTEADTAFAKALVQNPQDAEAMQMRGVTLFRMGKPADAIPLLERAHASIPNANIDPNYVLGVSYLQVHRHDDARRAFAVQYGFKPDSAPAYLLAARMFFRQEFLPIAEETANKALQLNSSLPLAHQLMGEIELAKNNINGAIAEFEKEKQINPLNAALYDRLGDAYIRNEQYDAAQHALNQAVLLEPNATGPYILLGKVLLAHQNPVMASMYLERALHMDPNNYITHSLLAQAYRTQGRKEDAAREFQRASQLQSSNTPR